MAVTRHLREAWDEAHFEEARLQEAGVLDADQPTLAAHMRHRSRMTAEFTPTERALIRSLILEAE